MKTYHVVLLACALAFMTACAHTQGSAEQGEGADESIAHAIGEALGNAFAESIDEATGAYRGELVDVLLVESRGNAVVLDVTYKNIKHRSGVYVEGEVLYGGVPLEGFSCTPIPVSRRKGRVRLTLSWLTEQEEDSFQTSPGIESDQIALYLARETNPDRHFGRVLYDFPKTWSTRESLDDYPSSGYDDESFEPTQDEGDTWTSSGSDEYQDERFESTQDEGDTWTSSGSDEYQDERFESTQDEGDAWTSSGSDEYQDESFESIQDEGDTWTSSGSDEYQDERFEQDQEAEFEESRLVDDISQSSRQESTVLAKPAELPTITRLRKRTEVPSGTRDVVTTKPKELSKVTRLKRTTQRPSDTRGVVTTKPNKLSKATILKRTTQRPSDTKTAKLSTRLRAKPRVVNFYDFYNKASLAKWSSSSSALGFPGNANDSRGFVRQIRRGYINPSLAADNILETHPQWVSNGWIEGRYPPMVLGEKLKFKALVGFLKGANASDGAVFEVFIFHKGRYYPIKSRRLTARRYNRFESDLSSWGGKEVQIVMRVLAGRTSTQDWAVWVKPRLTQ